MNLVTEEAGVADRGVGTAGMGRRLLPASAFVCCAVVLGGCFVNVAPPPRGALGGAPGRLRAGQGEVVAAGRYPLHGAAQFGLGLTDWLAIEPGLGAGEGPYLMGSLGLRATPLQPEKDESGLALDLDLGLAFGSGAMVLCVSEVGDNCGDAEREDWTKMLAYGGYGGLGLAYRHQSGVAAFVRLRAQLSDARKADSATRVQVMGGLDFTIGERVSLYAAVGYLGAEVVDIWWNMFSCEAGLGVRFDLWRTDRERPSRPPAQLQPPRQAEPPKPVEPPPRPSRVHAPCPPGSRPFGQMPEAGHEQYCGRWQPDGTIERHGWYRSWYDGGQPAAAGRYVDGRRHGRWLFWHADGTLRLEAHYHHGRKHGRWIFRDPQGRVQRRIDHGPIGEP